MFVHMNWYVFLLWNTGSSISWIVSRNNQTWHNDSFSEGNSNLRQFPRGDNHIIVTSIFSLRKTGQILTKHDTDNLWVGEMHFNFFFFYCFLYSAIDFKKTLKYLAQSCLKVKTHDLSLKYQFRITGPLQTITLGKQ